jgi:hypothetical protein
MVWSKKLKIEQDGKTYEGSAEELASFLSIMQGNTPKPEAVPEEKEDEPQKRKYKKRITNALPYKNYATEIKELTSKGEIVKLSEWLREKGHTGGSSLKGLIYEVQKICPVTKQGKRFVAIPTNMPIDKFKKKYKKVENDIRSKRMSWIHEKAKQLLKGNPTLSYETARSRAAFLWSNHVGSFGKSDVKPTQAQQNYTIPEFPNINPLRNTALTYLEAYLRTVVSEKRYKTTYYVFKELLLKSDDTINPGTWHDFLQDVLYKQKKICEYYNVKGHFRIEQDNKYDYLMWYKE